MRPGTSAMVYGAITVNRNTWNQVRDDSDYRAKQKTALSAGMTEKVDADVFANAANLSNVITQADLDDAALRNGYGRLRKTAKGKIKLGETDVRLYLPPEETANAMGIAAIKEYQIRGTIGSAVNAQMNAYGLIWRESGLIVPNLGNFYNPLLLKDAWALAWNEKPHMLDVQIDGLVETWINYSEYGVCEWFDSSGVVGITM
jgi:hypothetical protein